MTDVDDAIERAEGGLTNSGWYREHLYDDCRILANEVKRLRDESIYAPTVAMYGKPGREPICDFDCDYCRQGDE